MGRSILTGLSAGIKDSALTIHGSLQADRLGQYLAKNALRFTHIFSSDLQRAYKTAEAIRLAQPKADDEVTTILSTVTQLPLLREQDFGFYEGKPFYSRVRDSSMTGKDTHRAKHLADPGFKDVESKASMAIRMNDFLDKHLIPLLKCTGKAEEPSIAIVSHGIILSNLWRCILNRFPKQSVRLAPGLSVGSGGVAPLEHLGGWSNTGYLELEVQRPTMTEEVEVTGLGIPDASEEKGPTIVEHHALLSGWTMTINTINGKEHLKGLKRTGGGVGSSKFEEGQKKIESFFKKQKVS
ncbi:hypothetical protein MMC24_001721 [Lignoscripta atroalba]|nr:hypothetical protein [Lignoscripta atroalba]